MSTPNPKDALTAWLDERERIAAAYKGLRDFQRTDAMLTAGFDAQKTAPILLAMVRAALGVGALADPRHPVGIGELRALHAVREAMSRTLAEMGGPTDAG